MGISAKFQKGVRVSKVNERYKLCEIQQCSEEAIYSVLLREKWAELNHYTFWTHIASEELQHIAALIWYGCDGGHGAAGATAASAKGVGIRDITP